MCMTHGKNRNKIHINSIKKIKAQDVQCCLSFLCPSMASTHLDTFPSHPKSAKNKCLLSGSTIYWPDKQIYIVLFWYHSSPIFPHGGDNIYNINVFFILQLLSCYISGYHYSPIHHYLMRQLLKLCTSGIVLCITPAMDHYWIRHGHISLNNVL